MSENTDIAVDEKVRIRVPEPKRWKVILINDDVTPVDFVVTLLMDVFKHDPNSAGNITMQIHETGSGIAGVYNFEIAEIKSVESTSLARAAGYPLQIKMEEDK
jgi:ATP-dependent Clp protease adaptor protein ClpS